VADRVGSSGNKSQEIHLAEAVGQVRRARKETMRPLLFVNWSSVSSLFRGLMWIIAIVLAGVIVIQLMSASPPAHQQMHLMH
jgi:hypothetical protein